MRRYEQIYILRPSLSEDEITRVVENTNKLILDDEGAIIYLDKWGMRKLAYPIKKELQGYYVLCDFAASPEVVSEIERKFRIDDTVLKYLTVKVSDAISAEEISAAQTEAAAQAVALETEDETEESEKPEKVSEEVSSKEAPSKEAPSKEVPSKEAPSKEAPSKEVPSKEAPSEEAPSKEVPTEEVPTEDTAQ